MAFSTGFELFFSVFLCFRTSFRYLACFSWHRNTDGTQYCTRTHESCLRISFAVCHAHHLIIFTVAARYTSARSILIFPVGGEGGGGGHLQSHIKIKKGGHLHIKFKRGGSGLQSFALKPY